jgi:hypothetical protein
MPTDYTFVAGDSGVKAFTVKLVTAGSRTITATDTVTSSITGTHAPITITPTTATTFTVAGHPSPSTAGTAQSFTVTAKDPYGNTATGYTGTVTFTSSDAQAVKPSNYTFVAGDSGTRSFTATLRTAGTQSLTATDTVSSSITGAQSGISVTPANASTLLVAGHPSPSTAGVAGSFTVTARDQFGNTVTGYTGTVQFSSTDAQATLPANYTFVGADSGTKTFSATLKSSGLRTLTATDTVTGTITGSQTGINVLPAAAVSFAVTGHPSPSTAGVGQSFTVTAKDAFNNTATAYTGTVSFASSDGAATVPSAYTFVGADNGAKTFTATLRTAGTSTITATDTVT